MGLFRKERKRMTQILFSVILAHLSFFPFSCWGEAGKEGERKRRKWKGIKTHKIQAWLFVMNFKKTRKGNPLLMLHINLVQWSVRTDSSSKKNLKD